MAGFKIAIPARYGSTRLPGKPLLPLAGKPLVVHVCERALAAGDEVYLATDDARIAAAVAHLPVRAVMTRADHGSGTERLAELAERMGWADDVVVVNLQGDEPLMRPELIRGLAAALVADRSVAVATLATPITAAAEVFDPNLVKVVLDRDQSAIYFSRAPIPFYRDGFPTSTAELPAAFTYYRHIGLYAYSAGFLRRYVQWPVSPLETIEGLEQLRILWQRERIRVVPVACAPEPGVDTAADRCRVEARLRAPTDG